MYGLRSVLCPLFAILIVAGLLTGCAQGNMATSTAAPKDTVTPFISLTSTFPAPPASTATFTPTATGPVWERMENWAPANQVRAMLIDRSGDLWTGGPAGVVRWDLKTDTPTVYAMSQDPENTNVVALSQTPDGFIWAGTDGNGLAMFDGRSWQSFTAENGLPGNYINDQTVTPDGKLWVIVQEKEFNSEPNQKTHLGHFDGRAWREDFQVPDLTWLTSLKDGSLVSGLASNTYNPPNSNLYIVDGYDLHDWKTLAFDVPGSGTFREQGITAIAAAPDDAIWVTTWYSVLRYEDRRWFKIASPLERKNLPRVSSIVVSDNGTAWFGFSIGAGEFNKCGTRRDDTYEQGAYRYEGKTWTHFTVEDGLVDNKICAIGLDPNGNVWFGSFDRGVSRFDGREWKSFVIP